jgi:peptidoglycan/xylan/chitin deacetylase (PgdA/CDA1 family)
MIPHRSCILTYHSLDTSGSVISLAPQTFRDQMACLADAGVPVVPLDRIRETPGAVALTFDDGFRNFFDLALPVLQKHQFTATVFAVSSYCGRRNDWPTQPRNTGIPTLELMRWEELQQAANAGIRIGCHTATHPRLSQLSDEQLEQELQTCRAAIEDRAGVAADTFAYPYGDSNARVRRAAQRHFRLACGTALGFVSPHSETWDFPRLDVYYLRNSFWFKGLSKPYGQAYVGARNLLRTFRRALQPSTHA